MTGYIEKVVVFCGSQPGRDPAVMKEAVKLGSLLGQGGYELIYGGGTMGLMGAVARAAMAAGGKVKGIIPKIFHKAGAGSQGSLKGSQEDIVENMMIRKDQMILQADAAIALPGGEGTLDEIEEILVAQQLKTYAAPDEPVQPVIVVNLNGYYDDYIRQRQKMVDAGFLSPEHAKLITFVKDAEDAVGLLNYLNESEALPARHFAPQRHI